MSTKIDPTSRVSQAEILCALLRMSDGNTAVTSFPNGVGVVDRVLFEMQEKLPLSLQGLTFSQTNIGLRCLDLPDILMAASECCMLNDIGPSYTRSIVCISYDLAKQIVLEHSWTTARATEIARCLRKAIADQEAEYA